MHKPKPWTADDDAYLGENYRKKFGPQMAKDLGRSAGAIAARMNVLGLKLTPEERRAKCREAAYDDEPPVSEKPMISFSLPPVATATPAVPARPAYAKPNQSRLFVDLVDESGKSRLNIDLQGLDWQQVRATLYPCLVRLLQTATC